MRRDYLVGFLTVNLMCILGIYFLRKGSTIENLKNITSYELEYLFEMQTSLTHLWRPDDYDNPTDNDRIVAQYTWIKDLSEHFSNQTELKKKSVLLFHNGHVSKKAAQKIMCPGYELKLCTITMAEQIKLPLEAIGNYDAVIFGFVHRNKLNLTKLIIPKHVKQIVHTEETNYSSVIDFSLNDAISASYFSASDIVIPYGKWFPYYVTKSIIPRMDANDYKEKTDYAKGKTGMAVIFTTNCKKNVQNDRLGFVNALKKYIQVDVYGECGNGTLRSNCTQNADRKNNCMSKIIQRYKFYLAFENANCRDYITEKAYRNAFRNNVVPVVLGAHPDDYKRAFPQHSYIHVEDFDSPKSLSEYLVSLDRNDTLYNEYFWWKGTGEFHEAPDYALCRMCGMLFYSDYVKNSAWNVTNSTWKNINKCAEKNSWYWDKRQSTSTTNDGLK